jgi:hypothetical protein
VRAIPGDAAPRRRAGLNQRGLLGERLSRAAKLGWQVLVLRQPVFHRDHLIPVVHVQRGRVGDHPGMKLVDVYAPLLQGFLRFLSHRKSICPYSCHP